MIAIEHPKAELQTLTMRVEGMDCGACALKIENALKWVGDPHLAKVYQAALTQFQMPRWQAQVDSKLRLMREVVDLLNTQRNADRSLLLETMIFILIAVEVAMAFWRH